MRPKVNKARIVEVLSSGVDVEKLAALCADIKSNGMTHHAIKTIINYLENSELEDDVKCAAAIICGVICLHAAMQALLQILKDLNGDGKSILGQYAALSLSRLGIMTPGMEVYLDALIVRTDRKQLSPELSRLLGFTN